MNKILQFRCTDENCPANFTFTAISKEFATEMDKKGVLYKVNTGACRVCGKPGLMAIVPPVAAAKQRAECDQMLQNALNDLRKTAELLKRTLGKKAAGGAGNVG